jgi:hypothetical protein
MRKLKLEIADLRVESFHVAAEGRGGTVGGHAKETLGCPTGATCWGTCVSCNGTCDSCNATCATCAATCGTCACSADPSCASCALTCDATCGSCNPITCNPTVDPFGRCCGIV